MVWYEPESTYLRSRVQAHTNDDGSVNFNAIAHLPLFRGRLTVGECIRRHEAKKDTTDHTDYGTLPDHVNAWSTPQKQFLLDTVARCRGKNGRVMWSEVARVPLFSVKSPGNLSRKYHSMMRELGDADRKFYELKGEQSAMSTHMWSAAQDRALIKGAQKYPRNGGHVNWNKVCALPILKKRTKSSCMGPRNLLRRRAKGTSPHALACDNPFITGRSKKVARNIPLRKDMCTKSESIRLMLEVQKYHDRNASVQWTEIQELECFKHRTVSALYKYYIQNKSKFVSAGLKLLFAEYEKSRNENESSPIANAELPGKSGDEEVIVLSCDNEEQEMFVPDAEYDVMAVPFANQGETSQHATSEGNSQPTPPQLNHSTSKVSSVRHNVAVNVGGNDSGNTGVPYERYRYGDFAWEVPVSSKYQGSTDTDEVTIACIERKI